MQKASLLLEPKKRVCHMYDTETGTLKINERSWDHKTITEWAETLNPLQYKTEYADSVISNASGLRCCFTQNWKMHIFHKNTLIAEYHEDPDFHKYTLLLDVTPDTEYRLKIFLRLFETYNLGLNIDKNHGYVIRDRSHNSWRLKNKVKNYSGNKSGKTIPLVKNHTYLYPKNDTITQGFIRQEDYTEKLPQTECKKEIHNFICWFSFEQEEYHTCIHCGETWHKNNLQNFERLHHAIWNIITKIRHGLISPKFFLSMPSAQIFSDDGDRFYSEEYSSCHKKWIMRNFSSIKIPAYKYDQETAELLTLQRYTETTKNANKWQLKRAAEEFNQEIDELERIYGSCTLQKLSL